ncbi:MULTISPECIES: hypothetical protein [unclassified Arthrobacter]|uniref:hypothetical protein n=1 Tax=unclassified Arthrobacter TaxID=235627 RepID=UPI0028830762|nr:MULTISPECIES: hypothetical protein [unclassified Arthrobacter]
MNKNQALAIADASERLVYAYVSGNTREIHAAQEDLRIAKDISDGPPSNAVIAQLIENDPIGSAAAGILSFPDLQAIIASDLETHLDPEEVIVVTDNPANLRIVLAARMNGVTLDEMVNKPLLDRRDFALAARGDRRRAAELVEGLRNSLDKTKKK